MIRMALDGAGGIADLRFDLQARTVTVLHAGDAAPLLARLEPLGLGARVAETAAAAPDEGSSSSWSAPSASSGFAERARRPGPVSTSPGALVDDDAIQEPAVQRQPALGVW